MAARRPACADACMAATSCRGMSCCSSAARRASPARTRCTLGQWHVVVAWTYGQSGVQTRPQSKHRVQSGAHELFQEFSTVSIAPRHSLPQLSGAAHAGQAGQGAHRHAGKAARGRAARAPAAARWARGWAGPVCGSRQPPSRTGRAPAPPRPPARGRAAPRRRKQAPVSACWASQSRRRPPQRPRRCSGSPR